MKTRFRSRRAAALATIATMGLAVPLLSAVPASAAENDAISNAVLDWSLNNEAGGGAFFGGCNFLVAGATGDAGGSRVWGAADKDALFTTVAGNVQILKPDASGQAVAPEWDSKCKTGAGQTVLGSNQLTTGNFVRLSGGSGSTDAAGTTTVAWTGSFTAVFYGGMTYWSATDPRLVVDKDGNGTLTATGSGYGASMEDPGKWVPLAPRPITLATFTGGDLTDNGFTATPAYREVEVSVGGGTPQSRTGANWGSFPQDFVDFQQETGQSSYWYSSGGARDSSKPANPVTVSFTSEGTTPQTPSGPEEIAVDVPTPTAPETGSFGWEFSSQSPASLGTAVQSGANFTAEGKLNDIVVTDTRAGGGKSYSWSISGQVSDFASNGKTFSGGYLGWTPKVVSGDAQAGAAVSSTLAGGTGLGESRALASASTAASAVVGADLSLVIPGTTEAGSYTATLTVTALQ